MGTKSSLRILVVDDEEAACRVACEVARMHGAEPEAAPDADAALRRLRQTHGAYDAIIVDENMPGMTGSELLAHVRYQFPEITRVLSSGTVQRGPSTDAQLWLTKPWTTAQFGSLLEMVEERRSLSERREVAPRPKSR